MTPENTLCIFDFLLPVAQKHNESAKKKSIPTTVWQPAPGPTAPLPEEDLFVLPAEAARWLHA